ncbi:MAG: PPC domain-containing protein [Pseudomonadota bacterium]
MAFSLVAAVPSSPWRAFQRLALLGGLLSLPAVGCDCNPAPTKTTDKTCTFNSDCPRGQECDPERKVCVTATSGYCDADEDCDIYGVDLYCETQVHLCVSRHECEEAGDCPQQGMECQVDDSTGFRVCIFPGCEGDAECETELAGQCGAGTRARCVLRECICQDACGGDCGSNRVCCADTDAPSCIDQPAHCANQSCEPGYVSQADVEQPWSVDDCGYNGDQCSCRELPHLPLGDIGDPSVLRLRSDGSPVLVGHAFGYDHDATYDEGRYGDLALGTVDPLGVVSWRFIDGVPAGPIEAGPTGPRGGVKAPGDDVARQLDMVLDATDRVHVAYWDRSNSALRYARIAADGSAVVVVVVDDEGDTGLAPSIVLDPVNGAPRIGYFTRRVDLNPSGAEARLRVAVAAVPDPTTPSNFALHTAAVVDLTTLPCEGVCPDGELCQDLADPQIDRCVPEGTGCPTCGDAQGCIAGSCQAVIPVPLAEIVPPGIGLFTRILAWPGGDVFVLAYDSVAGDLVLATPRSGANLLQSGASFDLGRLDGATPANAPPDVGRHIEAVVDASGTLAHLTYVDDTARGIVYAQLTSRGVLQGRVVVDSARRPGPFGALDQHMLEDPAIAVSASGERLIVYQDATSGALWRCLAAAGDSFAGCEWVAGGEPGAGYRGSYGFSSSAAYDPGRGVPVFSTYRFVPRLDAAYLNGVVLFNHPAASACLEDSYEPNDTSAAATVHALAAMPGRICAGNEDWFSLTLSAGQTAIVRLGSRYSLGDLDLYLVDGTGTELERSFTTRDVESIDFTATAAGTYYLRVAGFNGAATSYILGADIR